jgi:hypothetical protein
MKIIFERQDFEACKTKQKNKERKEGQKNNQVGVMWELEGVCENVV